MPPARFLVANSRCLPRRRMSSRNPCPWRVAAIRHWRRFLRFGRYAAAVKSTADKRHDGVPILAKALVVLRCCSLGAPWRSSACRGPPSVFAVECAGRIARSPHRCLPLCFDSTICAFISVVPLFMEGRFCDPRPNSPNSKVSVSSHRDPSAQAYPWGRRHGQHRADNDRVLSLVRAPCQVLAGSLGRIICDLRRPVKHCRGTQLAVARERGGEQTSKHL
jgi:hypothetical protein